MLRNVKVEELISRLIVASCLDPHETLDIQLQHWGFTPLNEGETFIEMHERLRKRILEWWTSENNAIKDNGIEGVDRLNRDFNPQPSDSTYYFTFSFDATRPFPREYLSPDDLKKVPVNPLVSTLGLFPGPFNIAASALSYALSLGREVSSFVPGNPSDVDYARWLVDVANNHLSCLGYDIRIPAPGGRIPRTDMLPILSIFSLGMSGVKTRFGPSEENDGVVDTISMRGPEGSDIRSVDAFNTSKLESNCGVYWDMGTTYGIDHEDEVGVFTDTAVVSYELLPPFIMNSFPPLTMILVV